MKDYNTIGSHKLIYQEACIHPLSLNALLWDRWLLPGQWDEQDCWFHPRLLFRGFDLDISLVDLACLLHFAHIFCWTGASIKLLAQLTHSPGDWFSASWSCQAIPLGGNQFLSALWEFVVLLCLENMLKIIHPPFPPFWVYNPSSNCRGKLMKLLVSESVPKSKSSF